MTSLRDLPSVEQLLQLSEESIATYGRPLTLQALRASLDDARERFKLHPQLDLPSIAEILYRAGSRLHVWTQPTLVPVINATGMILHTNLGRAPLSTETSLSNLVIPGLLHAGIRSG